MRNIAAILAALVLIPGAAMADELSANLDERQGEGLASLVTGSGTITYGLFVGGIGTPQKAEIVSAGAVILDLQATFSFGTTSGTRQASGQVISDLNNDTGDFAVRITGSGGIAEGTLVHLGGGGGGGPSAGVVELLGVGTVVENDGSVTVTVTRAGGDDGDVSVDVATMNGSAVAGVDYVATSGILEWADGETASKSFEIPLIDDGIEDGDKTFTVGLSNPDGGVQIGAAEITITVIDDEALVCNPDDDTLCLGQNGRFKAEISWAAPDTSGRGRIIEIGLRDSGLFYFFDENNAEMLLKVLDGCGINGHYWVFYAATTNLEFDLTVTDTQTAARQLYGNDAGNAAEPILDIEAFATCP